MLEILKKTGYELPPRETDFSNLTTKEIFDKIAEFMSNANPKHEDLIFDFWQLIAEYPISMCQRKMSATLKLLITLFYFYKPPSVDTVKLKDKWEKELWQCFCKQFKGWYSYEQLGILFMRSKASIHDAIEEKKIEVQQLILDVNERRYARSIALKELVAEEKLKLLQQSPKGIENINKQTNIPLSA